MVTVGSIFGGRGMWIWYLISHLKLARSPLHDGWHRSFNDASIPTCFYLRRPSCPLRCLWGRRYLQGPPQTWQTASRWWYTWDLFHVKYFHRNKHALTLDHRSRRWWSWCILRLEEVALTEGSACQLPSPTRQGGRAQCPTPASLDFVIWQLLTYIYIFPKIIQHVQFSGPVLSSPW